jgi:hypothetical protein
MDVTVGIYFLAVRIDRYCYVSGALGKRCLLESDLLHAQGDDGIDAGGATRGDVAGYERAEAKH